MMKHYGQYGTPGGEEIEVAVSKSLHFLEQDKSNVVSLYQA